MTFDASTEAYRVAQGIRSAACPNPGTNNTIDNSGTIAGGNEKWVTQAVEYLNAYALGLDVSRFMGVDTTGRIITSNTLQRGLYTATQFVTANYNRVDDTTFTVRVVMRLTTPGGNGIDNPFVVKMNKDSTGRWNVLDQPDEYK